MSEDLYAYMDGTPAGVLNQNDSGRLSFTYLLDYLAARNATPLAPCLPLRKQPADHNPVRNYFAGLLPDSEQTREQWGKRYSVSPNNPFALLRHVGADAAGAIQVLPPELASTDALPRNTTTVQWLSDAELTNEVNALRRNPHDWQTHTHPGRWSLAGGQGKLALFHENGRWGIPSDSTPTTHILKPGIAGLTDSHITEYLCQQAARNVGLRAASTSLQPLTDGTTVLVSTRFDRQNLDGVWHRIHQVDMCQALGVHPNRKYQSDGGPNISSIADLLNASPLLERSDNARQFLQYLAYNYAIGGTDAHAKNFSLLMQGGSIVIAPLYDSASIFPHTHIFENQSSPLLLPMNIGHSRKFSDVTVDDWQQVGRKLLINETLTISLVRETVERTPDAISDAVTEFRTFAKEHELEYDQALLTRLSDGVAHQTKSSRITKSAPVPMALQAASPD